jgi:hypothetical protein
MIIGLRPHPLGHKAPPPGAGRLRLCLREPRGQRTGFLVAAQTAVRPRPAAAPPPAAPAGADPAKAGELILQHRHHLGQVTAAQRPADRRAGQQAQGCRADQERSPELVADPPGRPGAPDVAAISSRWSRSDDSTASSPAPTSLLPVARLAADHRGRRRPAPARQHPLRVAAVFGLPSDQSLPPGPPVVGVGMQLTRCPAGRSRRFRSALAGNHDVGRPDPLARRAGRRAEQRCRPAGVIRWEGLVRERPGPPGPADEGRGTARDPTGKTRRTTFGEGADTPRPEDHVERDSTADAPNRLWVADLTYVRTHADGSTPPSCSTCFPDGGRLAGLHDSAHRPRPGRPGHGAVGPAARPGRTPPGWSTSPTQACSTEQSATPRCVPRAAGSPSATSRSRSPNTSIGYNHCRLHGELNHVPPAEFEEAFLGQPAAHPLP